MEATITLSVHYKGRDYIKKIYLNPELDNMAELLDCMNAMAKTTVRTFLKLKDISEESFWEDFYFEPSRIGPRTSRGHN